MKGWTVCRINTQPQSELNQCEPHFFFKQYYKISKSQLLREPLTPCKLHVTFNPTSQPFAGSGTEGSPLSEVKPLSKSKSGESPRAQGSLLHNPAVSPFPLHVTWLTVFSRHWLLVLGHMPVC